MNISCQALKIIIFGTDNNFSVYFFALLEFKNEVTAGEGGTTLRNYHLLPSKISDEARDVAK